ncbi:MAG: hypothetical protein HYV99_01565 [Betaproteobacteria bacterium]|nr:hypothetical protein [Betaproteobacteria bacterium]
MARRAPRPKRNPEYEFQSIEECEESEKYGGFHRVEVVDWPPRPKGDEARPCVFPRCTRCGGYVPVYGDNDQERTGVEVVVIEREKRASRREPEKQPA